MSSFFEKGRLLEICGGGGWTGVFRSLPISDGNAWVLLKLAEAHKNWLPLGTKLNLAELNWQGTSQGIRHVKGRSVDSRLSRKKLAAE
ncbi:hypothetical protein N9D23_03965 [Rubripirellula sp.]|nr:hypothetical protein [Rubripirellula sp.]